MSMLAPKIVAARAIGELARLTGRGGGTSLPGKVLIRLEPHAIEALAGRMPQGCAVVSATNGKTTTAAMTASVLERAGLRLVHNRAGANMAGGVASSLLYAAKPSGRIDGEFGLFELDEFWLDRVTPRTSAAGAAAREPVPRSARPLRRTRNHRRPLGGRRRPPRALVGARAERR